MQQSSTAILTVVSQALGFRLIMIMWPVSSQLLLLLWWQNQISHFQCKASRSQWSIWKKKKKHWFSKNGLREIDDMNLFQKYIITNYAFRTKNYLQEEMVALILIEPIDKYSPIRQYHKRKAKLIEKWCRSNPRMDLHINTSTFHRLCTISIGASLLVNSYPRIYLECSQSRENHHSVIYCCPNINKGMFCPTHSRP